MTKEKSEEEQKEEAEPIKDGRVEEGTGVVEEEQAEAEDRPGGGKIHKTFLYVTFFYTT